MKVIMNVYQAIHSRRSVRKYTSAPVPREVLERIVKAGIEAPSGVNAQWRQYVIVDDPAVMERMREMSGTLQTAPAAIVILIDPQPTKYGEFWVQDASAAMQNMLLTTTAEGYAACWVEGAVRYCEDELRALLHVPESLRVWSLLSVGLPAETPQRPKKSTYAEVVHTNQYDAK